MIAKFDGVCKVTGQKIIAGETVITKVKGVWQVKPETFMGTKPDAHPPAKEKAVFDVTDAYGNTITVHSYLYIGPYGHWRIWKMVNAATGEKLDGEQVGFITPGSKWASNIGSSAKQVQKWAFWALNPVHGCESPYIG